MKDGIYPGPHMYALERQTSQDDWFPTNKAYIKTL